MKSRRLPTLALALALGGAHSVGATEDDRPPPAAASDCTPEQQAALDRLHGGEGPERFAQVGPGLYRGGQPSAQHLELLRKAGVETIIDLRRGDRIAQAEEEVARRLGMRFLRFPFFGPFGADSELLSKVVGAMRSNGKVYVHCHKGRDRTSLVVALYRVVVDGWAPARAWQREATAYGYRPGLWYGAIQRTFFDTARARLSRL